MRLGAGQRQCLQMGSRKSTIPDFTPERKLMHEPKWTKLWFDLFSFSLFPIFFLIATYFSFIDKNNLTNKNYWIIVFAMNVNEIPPKAGTRLGRIKTASRTLRVLIGVSLLIGAPYTFAVYFGWLPNFPAHAKILVSPHQLYASPSEMPAAVRALAMVRLGLSVFCYVVLYNLFRLYERGILFSAKNVRYIRFLGYYLMIDWAAIYQLESLSQKMDLSFTQPLIGLMIIFVAWIMDEGRKIQEDQELTV